MAGGQPIEVTALNDNIEFITGSVTNSLQWFANNLVQKNFLPRGKAQGILGIMGVQVSQQVSQLMHEVYTRIENEENKREWFDKFVAIFSRDSAYNGLVQKLERSVAGITMYYNCSYI